MTAFEVDRFERVDASAGTALLRLSGRFTDDPGGLPELVIADDGREIRRLPPVPDPLPSRVPAAGSTWRGAFALPQSVLNAGPLAFSLVTRAGAVDLPQPADPSAGAAGARPQAAVDVEWLQRQGDEASSLREALDTAESELERLRADLSDVGTAFDAARTEAADYADRLRLSADDRLVAAESEVQRLRAELEAEHERLTDTEAIAQEALGERVAMEDEVERLRVRPAGARRPQRFAPTAVLALVLVAVVAVVAVLLLSGALG
jgi:hypothetical protein